MKETSSSGSDSSDDLRRQEKLNKRLRDEARVMRDSYQNMMSLIEDSERAVERRRQQRHMKRVRKEVTTLAQEQRKTRKLAQMNQNEMQTMIYSMNQL